MEDDHFCTSVESTSESIHTYRECYDVSGGGHWFLHRCHPVLIDIPLSLIQEMQGLHLKSRRAYMLTDDECIGNRIGRINWNR